MTVNYRKSYGVFDSCGILFNHESPLRGRELVTRKITDAVARIKLGQARGAGTGESQCAARLGLRAGVWGGHRPAEVCLLIGDPVKARDHLGWTPTTTRERLCQMMVDADLWRNEAGFSF